MAVRSPSRRSSPDRRSGSITPVDETVLPDPQEASNYLKQTGSLPGVVSHSRQPGKDNPTPAKAPTYSTDNLTSSPSRFATPPAQHNAIPCIFSPNDLTNPMNWPETKKIRCVALGLCYAIMTGLNIGLYSASSSSLRLGMSGNPSDTEMRLGISMWVWAVALLPLVLAPFSEIYGRRWFYPASATIYGLCHLVQVYPRNLATLLVVRFIMGGAGAVGNTLVAGTIADIYPSSSRGWIMASFAFSIFAMNGVSLWLATIIVLNLGWQWVGWLSLIASLLLAVGYLVAMPETRGNVLLYRKKLRLEKETGSKYYALGEEERTQSWKKLITGSLTRPIYFLIHEPIVFSFSMWLAFLWGVQFLLIESVSLVFAQYGFSRVQSSLTFLSILAGGLIAFLGSAHQEHLYRRDAARAKAKGEKVKPESRLYHAMLGGVGFPIGALIFAWTGRPMIPWIAPCIGLAIIAASIFPAYMAIFSHLADVYETYSSSALACQSLCRNISVGIYVLFATPMYEQFPRPSGKGQDFSYALASTLLAAVGAVLGMVPFILYRYGEGLRMRSKIASEIWGAQEEVAHEEAERSEKENNGGGAATVPRQQEQIGEKAANKV